MILTPAVCVCGISWDSLEVLHVGCEIAAGSCQDVTRHGSTLALLGYVIDLLRGALSLFLGWRLRMESAGAEISSSWEHGWVLKPPWCSTWRRKAKKLSPSWCARTSCGFDRCLPVSASSSSSSWKVLWTLRDGKTAVAAAFKHDGSLLKFKLANGWKPEVRTPRREDKVWSMTKEGNKSIDTSLGEFISTASSFYHFYMTVIIPFRADRNSSLISGGKTKAKLQKSLDGERLHNIS